MDSRPCRPYTGNGPLKFVYDAQEYSPSSPDYSDDDGHMRRQSQEASRRRFDTNALNSTASSRDIQRAQLFQPQQEENKQQERKEQTLHRPEFSDEEQTQ